ncbi:hypothetical protein GE21DRAFT_1072239 [Neurospora crassa]|nr:hypothetical protein GE21DRAFT_1072239 [Neurospora crassa]
MNDHAMRRGFTEEHYVDLYTVREKMKRCPYNRSRCVQSNNALFVCKILVFQGTKTTSPSSKCQDTCTHRTLVYLLIYTTLCTVYLNTGLFVGSGPWVNCPRRHDI